MLCNRGPKKFSLCLNSKEEVTLDLVGNDFSAVVNDFGIPDSREWIPDNQE